MTDSPRADPMGSVRVRPYTPADRPACLAIFDSNVGDFFVPAERSEFEAYLDDLPGPYLVLERPDGTVVGCGGWAVEPETARADLCWGMVRRDLHGRGLGRALTEARVAGVREGGVAVEVALNTSQKTTGFYRHLGFEPGAVVPDGFAPGLDRCEMTLRLPRAIAFIGRKQNVRRWRFAERGLERGRLEEERALGACSLLEVVDDPARADLVQVRLNPERTSARALRKVMDRVASLPAGPRILNHPRHFALSAEKPRTFGAWKRAGLATVDHESWSLWERSDGQIARVRAFLDGRSGYLRTHNEDSGKGIVHLAGDESDRELRRAIRSLRFRSLHSHVSGSRALVTAEVPNRTGDVGEVFRVHMVGGEPIGGYALVGRGRVIHSLDAGPSDLDAFLEANERFVGWLGDPVWRAAWRKAMEAVRLDFGALEFFCVEGAPIFLEVNPMWGGRHRFAPGLTELLRDRPPPGARQRVPNVFEWLDPLTFYGRYWDAIAGLT